MKYTSDGKGGVIATTESKQEALDTLNELLLERNFGPLDENEARDWSLQGGETMRQLTEMANDYASEAHSQMCEWKRNCPSMQDIAEE